MANFLETLKSIRTARQATYPHLVKIMWGLTIAGILGLVLFFIYLSFQDLPTFEQLENPSNTLASEIYGASGESLGRYYVENRVAVGYDELTPHLVNALIATEDERFNEHSGIDFRAVARVLGRTVLLGNKSSGGGSTITQQLAKLLYSDRDFSGMNKIQKTFALATIKFKEWITAVKLEKSYTKEEIMAMYLNHFNFINGAYGIRAASEIYFSKSQDVLSLTESATLIGMLQNPSLHNPIKRPNNAFKRRNVVMGQMMKNKMITPEQFEKAKVLPLDIRFRKETHIDGLAPYFRMELRKDIQAILDRPECAKPDGTKYNIYKDGLKIYTTIDPAIQQYAERAVREHMTQLQKRFWQVWKGRDPWADKSISIDSKLRTAALDKIVQESERYQTLRSKYLDEIVEQIEQELQGQAIKDSEIDKLIEMDAQGGAIPKLMTDKTIPEEKISLYKQVLKSQHWGKLKGAWTIFQQNVRKSFRTPTRMKVFAYNARNEKDTVMTPLDSIKYHRMFLQTGVMAVDPTTGFVKAWVGGINYKYFQYDHLRLSRQVGSTFKPFVYATAIAQQGISPCFQVIDVPYTIRAGEGNFKLIKSWTPGNSTGKYSGKAYTLKEGLKESVNTVSVYLMRQLGDTQPVRGLVNLMGIDSSARRSDGDFRVPKQPSICLGATDLSVYEMTGAYTTFANNGVYNKPIFLTRIEDKNGRVIFQQAQDDHLALNPGPNYAMVNMLKYVTSGAPGFEKLKSEHGGKTGTTNDYVDGWFMGVTPRLVIGTWTGGEDRWIRFLSLADGQGGKMARPICSKLLQYLEGDPRTGYDYNARFKQPTGDIGIILDCNEYNAKNAPVDTPKGSPDAFFNDIFEEKKEQ